MRETNTNSKLEPYGVGYSGDTVRRTKNHHHIPTRTHVANMANIATEYGVGYSGDTVGRTKNHHHIPTRTHVANMANIATE